MVAFASRYPPFYTNCRSSGLWVARSNQHIAVHAMPARRNCIRLPDQITPCNPFLAAHDGIHSEQTIRHSGIWSGSRKALISLKLSSTIAQRIIKAENEDWHEKLDAWKRIILKKKLNALKNFSKLASKERSSLEKPVSNGKAHSRKLRASGFYWNRIATRAG